MYAQIIAPSGDAVLAAASTVEKDLKNAGGSTGNAEAAARVGQAIAERARKAGDRTGRVLTARVFVITDG